MHTILLSDGGTEGIRLRRDLSLALPCKLMVPDRLEPEAVRRATVLVSDLSLEDPRNVQVLRDALTRYRDPETPVLCILPQSTHRAVCQANALGTTATLPAGTARPRLLGALSHLLGSQKAGNASSPAERARRSVMQAGLSFAGIMDAAEKGALITNKSIEDSSDVILDAIGSTQVRSWLDVVWSYDDATYQHCLIVAGLAASFAYHLGFGAADRQRLVKAAVLHDVGKAGIPITILNKPGRLTETELDVMRTHPVMGYEMLVKQGGFNAEQLSVVRHHHELLDGSGYPDGLSGSRIGDLVRLTTICDIYAALIERRPYRDPLAPDTAFSMVEDMGDKLDQNLVHAFRKVMIDCLDR
jgi:putative nucleotidyltransferase with HDIG domain